MGSLGAGGGGGLWGVGGFGDSIRRRRDNKNRNGDSKRSTSRDSAGDAAAGYSYSFPLKQATTCALLSLTGDTVAQLRQRWLISGSHFSEHDWTRALRMASYGFLLYGPGSYSWYQFLDRSLPQHTVSNIVIKVILNQIVLGPAVIAAIFAWNNLWQGTLSELPLKYRNDALPTLLTGFRFWIPVSILNFWVVPLQLRVAFMSMASIFWNFYLSSTMNKNQPPRSSVHGE